MSFIQLTLTLTLTCQGKSRSPKSHLPTGYGPRHLGEPNIRKRAGRNQHTGRDQHVGSDVHADDGADKARPRSFGKLQESPRDSDGRASGLHTPWRRRCPNKVWTKNVGRIRVQFLSRQGTPFFLAVPWFNATMEIGKEETTFVKSSDIP
ncbi:uncharacterized protein B0T23DRAFT_149081 [Neurospora hispaniola]|uniref:Uncharacterized protein n=1 Tax=Neurospora hispaniola TaxID=588809 RepID=A0AAJ0MRL4_9PEZI|nr:hypothetical protein B0T23DRAFT_149081 [Neurospora hispaniola]